MTTVGISGTEFTIDGTPTHLGRTHEGHSVQGLLFNVRAVQAIYDDANPETRCHWAYPDSGVWDPERNVKEFCAALPSWRDHGVLACTVNLQGGGPLYVPEIYATYDNNGFTPQGALKPAYADRLARGLARGLRTFKDEMKGIKTDVAEPDKDDAKQLSNQSDQSNRLPNSDNSNNSSRQDHS